MDALICMWFSQADELDKAIVSDIKYIIQPYPVY